MNPDASDGDKLRTFLDMSRSDHPARPAELRFGQYVFTLLYAFRPDIADAVRGGPLDTFHDDSKVPALLEHVRARHCQ